MSRSRIIAVTGGAGSGKSAFALQLAMGLGTKRYFLACAEAGDDEMAAKIAAHQEERQGQFITIEEPLDVSSAIADIPVFGGGGGVLLWDCLTLWLSNALYHGKSAEQILLDLDDALAEARQLKMPVVVVTNEIGMGLVPMDRPSRQFRILAGKAGQRLAAEADEAYLVVMGRALALESAEAIVSRATGAARMTRAGDDD